LPVTEEKYQQCIEDIQAFRQLLDACFAQEPDLFPKHFGQGYEIKDGRVAKKTKLKLRRIRLKDGTAFTIRPSFVMPYQSGRVEQVQEGLFLRKFAVPYWVLARHYGRNAMYWYRLESSLGRSSIVGTTVRKVPLPKHLLADEHHQRRDGKKTYLATTVGAGCCLGVAVADAAGADDLRIAYGVFREEARDVDRNYAPETVGTDGWKATQDAWKTLFPDVVILLCFLHGWLKIRDRAKHLDLFLEIGRRVWDVYRAPNRALLAQQIRSLRIWAERNLSGVVHEKVLDLCDNKERWQLAHEHPGGHRTSNMLDRIMRGMNRYLVDGQHLHGSRAASDRHARAWALLWNFAPWSPTTTKRNGGWRSPAERLNQHRYHEHWLHNLLVSASLGGWRNT
jgi:hypothetical protein